VLCAIDGNSHKSTMRRIITFIILIAFFKVTHSQTSKKTSLIPTTSVIESLSHNWRLDSLAGNGFRLNSVKELFNSKLDSVSKDFLLDKLGKPNQLRTTNHGAEYVYYYFDIKAMRKNYNIPAACAYIAFKFKTNEKYVSQMVEGDIDR
jgi:hypothetical protein